MIDMDGGPLLVPFVQLCLDTLKRRYRQQRFRDTSSEPGNNGPWARDLAIRVFEEGFVGVECDEACIALT
jgi:hypothetical protein